MRLRIVERVDAVLLNNRLQLQLLVRHKTIWQYRGHWLKIQLDRSQMIGG
jgi:hypothetical protein